jgi:anti-sigma factor RsiW
MLTCQELVNFLMDYLDGQLPPDQRRRFEEHLNVCPPCVAYVQNYRSTVTLSRRLAEHPLDRVPDSVPEELVQAILSARPPV